MNWLKKSKKPATQKPEMNTIGEIKAHASPEIAESYIIKYEELTFENQKKLGAGGFGAVKLGKWNQTDVAVKFIPKDNNTSEVTFKNEVALLTGLHHPNVVQLYGFSEKEDSFLMVMELVSGGDLQKLIHDKSRPLELPQIIEFCLNICRGMIYLHKRDILHRDLKPANILVMNPDTGQIKITDFGLSRLAAQDLSLTSHYATPLYAAPELSKGEYDAKVDVFSFAIIMWEMFARALPWSEIKFSNVVVEKVKKGDRPTPHAERCPKQFRKLIDKCWAGTPKKRPTFEQIHEEIEKIKEELKTGNIATPVNIPSSASSPATQLMNSKVSTGFNSATSLTNSNSSFTSSNHPNCATADMSDTNSRSSTLTKQSDHDLVVKAIGSQEITWTLITLHCKQYLHASPHDLERIKYLFEPPNTHNNFIVFLDRFSPLVKETAQEQDQSIYETGNEAPVAHTPEPEPVSEEGYRISEIADMISPGYFHGFMGAKDADVALQNEEKGAFILRFSNNKGYYALDVKDTDVVRHWRIEKSGKFSVTLQNVTFNSFKEFIEHYTNQPLLNMNGSVACNLTKPFLRRK